MEDSTNNYTYITNKTTLDKIRKSTNEELYTRYITEKDKTDLEMDSVELWRKEFFDEAFLENPNKRNYYKRPFTASLSGKPLSYIGGALKDKILPFLNEGSKINAKNIIEDLEKILSENRTLSLKSINTVNGYIRDLSDFFTDSLSAAINNVDLETQADDDN